MFLVFVIKQVIDSPNVTQRIEIAAAQVDSPGKAESMIHTDILTTTTFILTSPLYTLIL